MQDNPDTSDRLALVLGAGGARGLAHIHALRAFDDLGITPEIVAGTSIGAIMGAAYCAGMTGAEIEEYIIERFDDRARLIADIFKIRPDSLASFLKDGGLRLGEFNLETILSVFMPATIPNTFEALKIPLIVNATDYYSGTATFLSTGDLRKSVAASAAMPAVFLPVHMDDRYYMDGSSTNPCPMDVVQGRADHVIAIDVSGGPNGEPDLRPTKVDAIYASSQIMQKSIARLMCDRYPNTHLLRPEVDRFRSLDFMNAGQILSKTAALREEVKATVSRLLDHRAGRRTEV